MLDNLDYEKKYLEKGYKYIAGIDEVGRGPLAGPVVCACVIMPLDEKSLIDGVTDSKKVSEKKRKVLAEKIKETAIDYAICEIQADEIDKINILEATKKCMYNAVNSLKVKPDILLVDALKLDVGCETEAIIKGDAKSYTIGAASIIAKVYRDELMVQLSKEFPNYGFENHKGYGTQAHINAIKEFGACRIHRRTFIKNFWEQKAND